MTKRTSAMVIVLSSIILAISCNGADLSSNGINNTLLNDTSKTINSTNSTLNSSFGNLTNESDLWSWGSVPAGYVRKDGKIIPEASLDSEGSVMETPSQLSPDNNNVDNQAGGLLVRPK